MNSTPAECFTVSALLPMMLAQISAMKITDTSGATGRMDCTLRCA